MITCLRTNIFKSFTLNKKIINIAIVDDNPAFRKGISIFLRKEEKFKIIGEFNTGLELLQFPELHNVNLILLDIELPEISGLEIAKRINFKHPDIKMIAITLYQDNIYIRQLVENGFRAFVCKTEVPETLLNTINATMQNKFIFPKQLKI
jgi:DNA-binding NarL/FixJ family response regulator